MDVDGILKGTNVNLCVECGKCTANCPISRFNPGFSPRMQLTKFLARSSDDYLNNDRIWNCLTCGMCRVRCPMSVNYTEFTRRIRKEAFQVGKEGNCNHGGALQSLMKIMTSENLNQNRMSWIPEDVQWAETGDTLYFIGCSPYFDAFFTELKVDTLAIARSTIRILNKLGITPVLLKNERCCGHDLLWAGDTANFERLARENLEEIQKVNPKRVIFSCAECYRTFKMDFTELFGSLDFEMLHLAELLADNLGRNDFKFTERKQHVTYQDPCRLGRHLGVYDAPRQVMNAIPGLEFTEMQKSGKNAVCCGTNLWINCDKYSKMIQTYRLTMARATGADMLITSCPKCYIHFTCAMQGDKVPAEGKIKIKDLALLAAESIET